MFTFMMRICVSDSIGNLSPLIQRQLTQRLRSDLRNGHSNAFRTEYPRQPSTTSRDARSSPIFSSSAPSATAIQSVGYAHIWLLAFVEATGDDRSGVMPYDSYSAVSDRWVKATLYRFTSDPAMWIQGDVEGAPLASGAFSGCYFQALATGALAPHALFGIGEGLARRPDSLVLQLLVLNDSLIREEGHGRPLSFRHSQKIPTLRKSFAPTRGRAAM